MAFGPDGALYVADALAAAAASTDSPIRGAEPELVVGGSGLVGVAFGAGGRGRVQSHGVPIRQPTATMMPAGRFRRKPIADVEPAESGQSLKRVLGAGDLVDAGDRRRDRRGHLRRDRHGGCGPGGPRRRNRAIGAGPALILSFLLLGAVCALAALCYAELAAMIPQAGSAYAYAYATLGEVVAWIIGWDLILEYAVGNVAVAISWGDYFNTLLRGLGIDLPMADHRLPHGAAQLKPRRERALHTAPRCWACRSS